MQIIFGRLANLLKLILEILTLNFLNRHSCDLSFDLFNLEFQTLAFQEVSAYDSLISLLYKVSNKISDLSDLLSQVMDLSSCLKVFPLNSIIF